MSRNKNQSGFALEFVLIGVMVVLLVAATMYFMTVLRPRQEVNNAASKFVETSVDGDYEDAVDLTDADKEDASEVEAFALGIDEGVGSDDYKVVKTTIDGDDAKVKFEVDEDDDRTISIELEKKKGDWLVTGVVYKLGDSEKAADPAPTESVAIAAPAASACLPAAALEKHWRYKSEWQFYFKADSNVLEHGETVAVSNIKQMKTFYDENKQYNFAFVIDVSLYQSTGSQADQQIATDRAGVVAYNMNLLGIPFDYIRFGEAISGGNPDTPEYATGSRNAVVAINSSCDALSTPADFNSKNTSAGV